MNVGAARAGSADGLTRTTLQFDARPATIPYAEITQALQRVPGVLLAEVHAASRRAVVAHDAAVPGASLVAAVARMGVQAKIVADTRPAAALAGPSAGLRAGEIRYLATLAALAFLSLALVDIFLPNSADRRYASVVISAFWVFLFAQVIVGRRA